MSAPIGDDDTTDSELVSTHLNGPASSRQSLVLNDHPTSALWHQQFLRRRRYIRTGGRGPNLLYGRNPSQSHRCGGRKRCLR